MDYDDSYIIINQDVNYHVPDCCPIKSLIVSPLINYIHINWSRSLHQPSLIKYIYIYIHIPIWFKSWDRNAQKDADMCSQDLPGI